MATLSLTDEQVVELVMQLPPESKMIVLNALNAEHDQPSEPQIVNKRGLLVVRAPLLEDVSDIVDRVRESRIAALLAVKAPAGG